MGTVVVTWLEVCCHDTEKFVGVENTTQSMSMSPPMATDSRGPDVMMTEGMPIEIKEKLL